jgi:hypothetical protein
MDYAPYNNLARHGFTLSYLRQVPELSYLARQVVLAIAKDRGGNPESYMKKSSEGIAPKMKRLFIWGISELCKEGSIVLWEGPKRSWAEMKGVSGIWDNMFIGGDFMEDDEEIVLSDPEEDEKVYISH